MKNHVLWPVLTALLAGVSFAAPSLAVPSQAPTAPKYALLIAISRYNGNALEGPENDVTDVKKSLIENFGFRPGNILVLRNEKATRRGIVAAIRSQLMANARKYPTGTFLFYYSGHGSTTRDVDGDEKRSDPGDTFDETLVPFDWTRDTRDREHFDLVDDETDRLFSAIRTTKGFTGSLTSIIDACNSGTATRGVGDKFARVREIPQDTRIYPPSVLVADLPRATAPQKRFAAFSSCMAHETSMETLFPATVNGKSVMRSHGVLTYYLLQVMANATRSSTNGQIWVQLARPVSKSFQNPLLEGDANAVFLGGATRETVPLITYQVSGRKLVFSRGIESGALKGGFVALYGGSGTTRGNRLLQQLQISSSRVGRSEIILPQNAKVPERGTVQLLTPFFGNQELLVGWSAQLSSNNPVVKRLVALYGASNSNYVRVARPGEIPHVVLTYTSQGTAFIPAGQDPSRATQSIPHPERMGYSFSLGKGKKPLFDVFLSAQSDKGLAFQNEVRLRQTLENYAVHRNILGLSNEMIAGQQIAQPVKLSLFRAKGAVTNGEWKTRSLTPVATRPTAKLKVGERVQVVLDNQGSQKLYAAILWLGQDGSVTVLDDADFSKVITLEPAGSPKHSARTGIFRVLSTLGEESLKVFVSKFPIDPFYLERPAVDQEPDERGKSKGLMSPLDTVAAQATGTRGGMTPQGSIDFSSWGTQSIRLSISK